MKTITYTKISKEVKKILDQLHVIDSHIFQELTILSVLNSSPKTRNSVKNSHK